MLWELKMLTIWSVSLLMVKCAPGVLICSRSLRYVLTTVYCVCGGYRILEEGVQDTDCWRQSPVGGSKCILPRKIFKIGPQIWDLRYSEAKSACDLGVWPTSRTLLDPPQCMVKKKGKSFVYFNCQRKFSLLSRLLREQLVLVPCE